MRVTDASPPPTTTEPVVFEPQGVRDAVLAGLLRGTLQVLLKPVLSPRCTIGFQRGGLSRLTRLSPPVPPSVVITSDVLGGVAGEWLRVDSTPAENSPHTTGSVPTILYLHGGAYCIGSAATHRSLTARLAQRTGWPVFALNYRLAPEHPYPAALEDALAACDALQGLGPVVIAGDSAGGGLALATAQALRDSARTQAQSLLLLAPWVDLCPLNPKTPLPGEALLNDGWLNACARLYHRNCAANDPGVSPLRGSLQGLPPTLIQSGFDDRIVEQSLLLHTAMRSAGVDVRCDITARRWHVFQLQAGILPSADAAVARLAAFAHTHRAHQGHPAGVDGARLNRP